MAGTAVSGDVAAAYGDEFEELLREHRLTLGEFLDVVKSALSARLSATLGHEDSNGGLLAFKGARKMRLRSMVIGLGTLAAVLMILALTSAAGLWHPAVGALHQGADRPSQSRYQVHSMGGLCRAKLLPFQVAANIRGLSVGAAITIQAARVRNSSQSCPVVVRLDPTTLRDKSHRVVLLWRESKFFVLSRG